MNNYTNENTTTTAGAGSRFGNRVKGATEVIHGAGENLRGTMLGAVDTMTHGGVSKNDEIARQGRLEIERGLTNMNKTSTAGTGASVGTSGTSGAPASLTNQNDTTNAGQVSHANATLGTANPSLSHGGPSAEMGPSTGSYSEAGTGQQYQNFAPPGNEIAPHGGAMDHPQAANVGGHQSTYPGHHRDDAVAAIPQKELNDITSQQHGPPMTNPPDNYGRRAVN